MTLWKAATSLLDDEEEIYSKTARVTTSLGEGPSVQDYNAVEPGETQVMKRLSKLRNNYTTSGYEAHHTLF